MKQYSKIHKVCVVSMLILLSLLPCTVQASELTSGEASDVFKTVKKNIYHEHKGNEKDGGECYTEAVLHKHKGNPSESGECYETPIYHLHTGETVKGGGCFGEKVYHSHKGSEASGGECYKTPVYHAHTGSAQAGGGCYSAPTYHSHEGNENSGGACYQPVYHQHTQNCYREEQCEMIYVGALTIVRQYDDWCSHHGNTQIKVITAHYKHSSCGGGTVEAGHSLCWICYSINKSHGYKSIVCGKNETTLETYQMSCTKGNQSIDSWKLGCTKNDKTVERYKNSCGKTTTSVDSYKRNCERNATSIDAYALSCIKEEGEIEFHVRTCEKEEGTVYGYLSVSNNNTQWTSSSTLLKVSYILDGQDWEGDYLWEKDGTVLESQQADQVEVADNGKYIVKLRTPNTDIGEDGLWVAIQVKNIDKTPPAISDIMFEKEEKAKSNVIQIEAADLQPDGSSGSGLAVAPFSYDGGKTWTSEKKIEVIENGVVDIKVRDACGNIATDTASIENIQIEDTEKEEDGNKEEEDDGNKEEEDDDKKKDEDGGTGKGDDKGADEKNKEDVKKQPEKNKEKVEKVEIVPLPEDTATKDTTKKSLFPIKKKKDIVVQHQKEKKEIVKKEAETVISEPKAAEPIIEVPAPQKMSNKKEISPILKAFTFTMGSVAGVSTLIWVCYLFFMSIRIYHSDDHGDGEGKYFYAGSCIMKKTEDIFEVTIPSMILEQSDTGRFSLRLGRLFYKRYKGKELIVTTGQQQESVWIDEEIPFRVQTYV